MGSPRLISTKVDNKVILILSYLRVRHSLALGGAGDLTSNLPVTSQPALPNPNPNPNLLPVSRRPPGEAGAEGGAVGVPGAAAAAGGVLHRAGRRVLHRALERLGPGGRRRGHAGRRKLNTPSSLVYSGERGPWGTCWPTRVKGVTLRPPGVSVISRYKQF